MSPQHLILLMSFFYIPHKNLAIIKCHLFWGKYTGNCKMMRILCLYSSFFSCIPMDKRGNSSSAMAPSCALSHLLPIPSWKAWALRRRMAGMMEEMKRCMGNGVIAVGSAHLMPRCLFSCSSSGFLCESTYNEQIQRNTNTM